MSAARPLRSTEETSSPGQVLRALRIRRGWTLAEVGARTGLPISTLSKLETGKASFTYDKLVQVARGLEIDMLELLTALPDDSSAGAGRGRRSICRRGEGAAVDSGSYGYKLLASDLLDKHFIPMVGLHHARTLEEFGPLISHPGEEFIYVLDGVLELHTSLYAPVRLETGDSIYFDSEMGHAYLAAGGGPCTLLTICSKPEPTISVQQI